MEMVGTLDILAAPFDTLAGAAACTASLSTQEPATNLPRTIFSAPERALSTWISVRLSLWRTHQLQQPYPQVHARVAVDCKAG